MGRNFIRFVQRSLIGYKPNYLFARNSHVNGLDKNLKFVPFQGSHFHTTSTSSNAEKNELPVIISPSKYQTRSEDKIQKISKAMKAYVERAHANNVFMKQQTEEFEMGKRHLANMMGVEPHQMTQNDINEAIAYLMPSGLFEPKARPFMKHPDEVFPKQKAAEFDVYGRPYHFLFYTGKPQFYQLLHDVGCKFETLDAFQDKMIQQGVLQPPPEMKLILTGSDWIKVEALKEKLLEELNEYDYDFFLVSMKRFVEHPYSYREKDFIMKYRKVLAVGVSELIIPPLLTDENGRLYSKATGYRKFSVANVTLRANGTGKVKINGKDICYFENLQDRHQLLFPLQFTDFLQKVDIESDVEGTGDTAKSGALRHAISLALLPFVEKEMIEKMRLAGLLTRDPRSRERKKPGQKGARAKYTWLKR